VVYDGVIGPWFLPTFLLASGLKRLHYVILLPPQAVCVQRVESRKGHGLTDPGVARHMWREFHQAKADPRHVLADHDAQPDAIASALAGRLEEGSIRYP
jgi:hypothetical protein